MDALRDRGDDLTSFFVLEIFDKSEPAGRLVDVNRPANAEDAWSEQPPVFWVPQPFSDSLRSGESKIERYAEIPAVRPLGPIRVDHRRHGERHYDYSPGSSQAPHCDTLRPIGPSRKTKTLQNAK